MSWIMLPLMAPEGAERGGVDPVAAQRLGDEPIRLGASGLDHRVRQVGRHVVVERGQMQRVVGVQVVDLDEAHVVNLSPPARCANRKAGS